MRPPFAKTVAQVWQQYRYAQLAVILCGFYDFAFGLILALGGPGRVASASFVSIRVTGGHVMWGAIIATLGVLILASTLVSRRGVAAALAVAALAHLFLTGGFVVAALTLPDAALTGIATYLFASGAHAIQSMVHNRTVPALAP